MSYKTNAEERRNAMQERDEKIANLTAVLKTTRIALRNALAILEVNLTHLGISAEEESDEK